MAKNLKTSPQTRSWTPENDCCNRSAAEQNHAPGCVNNPLRKAPETSVKAAPDKGKYAVIEKKAKEGACQFTAKGRCYVEGVLLEDAGQTITLSPAASYRQRNNRNLELVSGVIPVLPEDGPQKPGKDAPFSERQEFVAYETSFIENHLDDSDPLVGAAPGGLKLIKQ